MTFSSSMQMGLSLQVIPIFQSIQKSSNFVNPFGNYNISSKLKYWRGNTQRSKNYWHASTDEGHVR